MKEATEPMAATALTLPSSSAVASSSGFVRSTSRTEGGRAFAVPIPLGTYLRRTSVKTQIICDDARFVPHVGKPWLTQWLYDRYDIGGGTGGDNAAETPSIQKPPARDAYADDERLKRHMFACGASGSGKSRLALHLAVKQLTAGCSVVAIDLKDQTILHLLSLAEQAGYPKDQIILMMPEFGSPPAWNPLDGAALGLPAQEAANQFAEVVEALSGTGAQLGDLMANALLLTSAHRLSLYETVLLLRYDAYRDGLLKIPPVAEVDDFAYDEVVSYFTDEFAVLSVKERRAAAAPVIRRLRAMIRDPFMRAMLCSDGPSFRLTSLWNEPRLVLANLDEGRLGKVGARTLGTLLARQMFLAANRAGGKGGNPVVLFLDEIGECQKFLGEEPERALTRARSYDLRVIAACQFLSKLEENLRSSMLVNTSVQAMFRLEPSDARLVASWLSEGAADVPAPMKVILESDPKLREETAGPYPICDANGNKVQMSKLAFAAVNAVPGPQRVQALENHLAFNGLPVPAMAAGKPLKELVKGLKEWDWHLSGPVPVELMVTFPRPKVQVRARSRGGGETLMIKNRLVNLKVRHAVLNVPGYADPCEIEAVSVPDPLPIPTDYIEASLSTGQGQAAARAALEKRKARIREVAAVPNEAGSPCPVAPDVKPIKRSEKAFRPRAAAPVAAAQEDDSV